MKSVTMHDFLLEIKINRKTVWLLACENELNPIVHIKNLILENHQNIRK